MSTQDRIVALKSKHADLEERLHSEQARPMPDETVLRSIKHEKLQLKDEIASLKHSSAF